ncbi:MAG: hypothetical protein PHQ23_14105 [Candidatus Wallbacteria bacterium]|nr:hypothetical protein [Candidatus Wallbacteria bacterium]
MKMWIGFFWLALMSSLLTGCFHHQLTPQESKWQIAIFLPYSNLADDGQYKLSINKSSEWVLDPTNTSTYGDNSFVEVPIGGLTYEVSVRSTQFPGNPVIYTLDFVGYYSGWSLETATPFTRIY